ncbi:unnamed protein product, partial [Trichogramma brassicae]
MTMVEGRPMVTVIMPTLAVDATVVRGRWRVTANDANVDGDANGVFALKQPYDDKRYIIPDIILQWLVSRSPVSMDHRVRRRLVHISSFAPASTFNFSMTVFEANYHPLHVRFSYLG